MAIISFTNYKRGQTTGCMGAVMRYTMQDKKTEFEGQQLVTGINCQPESVYADFMTTKRLHHKTDGVLFYHMVQSFPKGEVVDPVTAHAAALKLAEYYEGYEVLVCTHTDREHIHSHFLINSVNFDTGKKLHVAKEQLQELRQRNDQVCVEFSLPVFNPTNRKEKTKTMSIGEYHTATRGQSKKLQLMNIINDCMLHASNREEFIALMESDASNREEFIALMESEGYKVRWETSRRNITYTTPSGWQCRDRLLFGDKYLKENMEYEFRIREEVIYGRAVGEEPTCADGTGHTATSGAGADTASRRPSYESGVGGSAERPLHTGVPHRETRQTGYLKKISELLAQLPTRTQMDELLKAVKHLEKMSEQAGKQKEKRFSLPGIKLLRLSLPDIPWTSLLLGLAALALTGLVLWVVWSSLDTLWSAAKGLLP